MKSKSYYFSHDYNAANDTKILFLRHQLGMEGYGIYWFLIERLADAGGKLPIELIPVLAMQMQSTDIKVKGVITQFDLFTIVDGEFWSERLQSHLGLREKLSQSGKNGALNRWGNGEANRGAIGEGNANKRKEKEIKENKSKLKLFSETEFIDIEIFSQKFIGTQYENANFNYYHEVINNWSSAGGNKKVDWIATARGFMARDMKEGKFVDINFNPNAKRINQDRKPTYAEQQAAIRNSY
jgi:hypothetical protein